MILFSPTNTAFPAVQTFCHTRKAVSYFCCSSQPVVQAVACVLLLVLGPGHGMQDTADSPAKAERLYLQALQLR